MFLKENSIPKHTCCVQTPIVAIHLVYKPTTAAILCFCITVPFLTSSLISHRAGIRVLQCCLFWGKKTVRLHSLGWLTEFNTILLLQFVVLL